jgi:fructose transport system ATP-binding protein
MRRQAARQMSELEIGLRSMANPVEDLSGGQRQGVAVARAAAFARKFVIMDESTAALGVRESGQVLDLIRCIRNRGLPVILISHNMPHVFEVADRIHIQRLGRRVALVASRQRSMSEVVAIMTGAMPGTEQPAAADRGAVPEPAE